MGGQEEGKRETQEKMEIRAGRPQVVVGIGGKSQKRKKKSRNEMQGGSKRETGTSLTKCH